MRQGDQCHHTKLKVSCSHWAGGVSTATHLPPHHVCPAGTVTVHLWRDSRGHLSLVAHPQKENREHFEVSPESTAVTMWQTLQQTTGSGAGARPLAQWQHQQRALVLQER